MIYFFSIGFIIISIVLFSILTGCFVGYFANINFLSFGGYFWYLNVNFDLVSMFILLMLFICFVYVISYSHHYFNDYNISVELNYIICLFVMIMASLICTGDFLLTLIFWEYLGVVSFFLILFYGSYLSLRSSIITLVSSRFGDVCIFLLMCLSCYSMHSIIPVVMLFFFIIFTKSASFPFISWLLEAMRAPTPVSSLVHSSTLVAAGIWFAMRYDFLLYFDNSLYFSVLLLLTIFITGISSFFFIDLKKIVALSTCNNISWCVFYLIFGDLLLALFQLISHGVSKCMLFMLVGDVMSGTGGSQSSNCVYNSYLYGNWGIFSLFCVILGLSGAPFIGVFFTKHFFLVQFMNIINVCLYVCVFSCVMLSYLYSFRLCSVLLNLKSSVSVGVLFFFNTNLMVYFWLFINYFIFYLLDEDNSLSLFSSVSLILFQCISCIIAYYLYDSQIFSNWSSSMFGCDNLVELFYYVYNLILNIIMLSFYRWDNYMLTLFNGIGYSTINVYIVNLLNIVVFVIFVFLTCFCILY